MIVAVENGLFDIKRELSMRGYTTVWLDGCNFPIDAIVYKSIHLKPWDDAYFKNSGDLSGILMIYANNKSIDEIDNILRTRMYGPLL